MTVVKSNSMEHLGRVGDIALHVIPEIRTITRAVTVAQLHVVAPRNQLTAQVDVGT